MRDRFGAQDPRSQAMRFHVQTAGSTLTAQQPLVNVVRTSFEALAAVLGGAQSLHTNSYDEALALPTEQAAKLALRTQQVLAEETGIANTADPLGGSYAIEGLTDEIEQGARGYLDKVDAMGGMIAAIERGFVQREIQSAAYEFQKKVETGEQKLVGVNAYRSEEPQSVPIFRIDETLEERRRHALTSLHGSRDGGWVRACLEHLAAAARSTDNLMPAVLDAVEAYATVGEISDCLREIFGEHQDRVLV